MVFLLISDEKIVEYVELYYIPKRDINIQIKLLYRDNHMRT